MKNFKLGQIRGVGNIVVKFSLLEAELNSFIGWLLGTDVALGQIVTAHIYSFSQRNSLFFRLYKRLMSGFSWVQGRLSKDHFKKRDTLLKQAEGLFKRARKINEVRNDLIHSVWSHQQRHLDDFANMAPFTAIKIAVERSTKIKGGQTGLKYELPDVTVNQLSETAISIEKLTKDFQKLKAKTELMTGARQ